VSLSTDDPSLLTALAAGHVTVTAGTASADITVFAGPLPPGTVIWSNPGDGSGVQSIVPAVPSTTGVADVFAFQADGTVQAITSDGTVAWTANIGVGNTGIPDFQGGLVVETSQGSGSDISYSIYKLDGIDGHPYAPYTTTSQLQGDVAVHPDGTIFVFQNGIVGINPLTGGQKFSVPWAMPAGFWCDLQVSGPIIAGDGYAYATYVYADLPNDPYGPLVFHDTLMRVDTSGNSSTFHVFDAPGYGGDYVAFSDYMITNADQGILLSSWNGLATVTGAGLTAINTSQLPNGVVPILQAQDGSFFGGTGRFCQYCTSSDNSIISFDITGTVRWTVTGDAPYIATADGGVIGQSGITYDQNGNATGMMGILAGASPGWPAHVFTGGAAGVALNNLWVEYASSWGVMPGGNPSGNGTAAMMIALHESKPTWWTKAAKVLGAPAACTLGTANVLLGQETLSGDLQAGNAALNQYNASKASLLAYLGTLTPTSTCATSPGLGPLFGQLQLAVEMQVPFDGPDTTLSEWAAGAWIEEQYNQNPSMQAQWQADWLATPVCGEFWKQGTWSGTTAVATAAPGWVRQGVYFATQKTAIPRITEATILHEALHNMTGFGDDTLYNLVSGTTGGLNGHNSCLINLELIRNGCAEDAAIDHTQCP
jgi:hypothetical protein